MISSTLRRIGLRRIAPLARNASTVGPGIPPTLLNSWYSIFGNSTAGYISWIVAGVVLSEGITGYGTDMVWNYMNYNRTYESIDWSKFAEADEEEEEDEDDDDEEEGDDDEEEGDDDEDDDDDDE